MPRDVGLRQADFFHHLMNRTLLCAQARKDAQTGRISEQSEVVRNLFENL